MATTNLNLQVSFTATYVGEHRVCWRIQGSGDPYDCTTLVMAVFGANVTIIFLVVEENYCGPYEFEGYVQPTCVAEGDPSLKTAWTPVQYVNTPDCEPYVLTCSTVSLARIDITNWGTGYDPLPGMEPLVTVAGDATAIAVVDSLGNGIKTYAIVDGGSGYYGGGYGKAINIPATTATLGIDAKFDVTVSAGVVVEIVVRDGGSAWTPGDNFSFSAAALGGTVLTPFIGGVAAVTAIGNIKQIQLTFIGTGYNSVPVVSVDPPLIGDTAAVVARLTGCQSITGALLGPNCDASVRSDIVSMPLNSAIKFCNPTLSPPLGGYAQGWTQSNGECCYLPCTCYNISLDAGGTVEYYYTDCITGNLTYGTFEAAGPWIEPVLNVVEGTLQAVWLVGTGTSSLCP
jgi:hypothetical protein